jgi:hypothetical protein
MPGIEQIETQLQQRLAEYPQAAWGRKQNDAWDHQTNFIYGIYRWDMVKQRVEKLDAPLREYAINRWFNFWSAQAVERIFCESPGVTANLNQYDRLVDFSIVGIKFDHKTSVFPKQYGRSLQFARENQVHLIQWLYRNQSRQQRYHAANRLFVLLYAGDGEHWKLRADIGGLRRVIEQYVDRFDPAGLTQLTVNYGCVLADIVWYVR